MGASPILYEVMKFSTLEEIEQYFDNRLPEGSSIAYVTATMSDVDGYVFGFDVEDDCDVMLAHITKWNNYYHIDE